MKRPAIRTRVGRVHLLVVIALVVAAFAGGGFARPYVKDLLYHGMVAVGMRDEDPDHDHSHDHDHTATTADEHDHDHEHEHEHGTESADAIELSPQALKNLGLTSEKLKAIELGDYQKMISVPAIITARPGRTKVHVSSPLSGVVTHVHAVTGETVTPGQLLFEVRLTYEDLVVSQTEFLQTISELEVENREISRLEEVTQSGAISGKSLLERRYARDKLEASLASQREALKLHGLNDDQIVMIERDRKLLRDLAIVAPDIDSHADDEQLRLSQRPIQPVTFLSEANADEKSVGARPLVLEELRVQKGQGVAAGEMLCALSDFSQLYIEGRAFEQDLPAVTNTSQQGWEITAVLPAASGDEKLTGLHLEYVGNTVDIESRTLPFFVGLPNQIIRDETNREGQRFTTWKYRVGQRLQVQVPIEVWERQIVLPSEAVVKEGAEWFVFRQNGNFFERVAVHVKHRDNSTIVIDHDGALFPGDVVAMRSAHQLQMALKNKSGGGIDPHAGHNH